LWDLLDDDDRGVDQRADGDRDPPRDMMFAPTPKSSNGTNAMSTASGSVIKGTAALGGVPEKSQDHDARRSPSPRGWSS
jgi:hypothetical protein